MKVAVLGAGASGLPAIKCCLDEGLEPTCFERTDYIGGLWHYTDEVEKGQACVMKSTVINTSKEMMCYSDFPIPKEYPTYMHNEYVDKYFNLYADEFKLRERIKFNSEVINVKQSPEFDKTGQWDLTIRHTKSDQVTKHTFDAVLVCTGHHAEISKPSFPGMDTFKGNVIHSHDYKDFHGYEGKRVVVVGIGNSGVDVAVELSRVASQVYLSTRRGSWILNRVGDSGKPGDMLFSRAAVQFLPLFRRFADGLFQWKLNQRFDHKKYCLQPDHGFFSAHPTVNDDLPNKIIAGRVKIKANIATLSDTSVKFEDGSEERDIDTVVLATGYVFGFPFLDKTVVDVKDNQVNLYKYIFPTHLKKNTLAIIGCFQPLGAIMPCSEQQCRLATRVFQGKVTLPTESEMISDIRTKESAMSKRYVKSKRHTIQVDYLPYMDELSGINGNKPDFAKLFLTDPKLALSCYFGPGTPYQFRLMGPGSWKGARGAILTQWERTYYPLQTRPMPPDKGRSVFFYLFAIVILFALMLMF